MGKSTIIRMLFWILTNGPSGDWMRTFDPDGEEGERLTASACIILSDDNRITRTKGDNINAYYLNEEEFTKVGRGGPPEPIIDIIGQLVLPFGKDLIPCIAMQDELPFMVFESAPNKGGLLNYLTGVDIGDKMRKDIGKEVRQRSVTINRNLADIEEIETELDKYKGLDDLHLKMEKGQYIEKRLEKYKVQYFKLGVMENTAKNIDWKIRKYQQNIEWLEKTIVVGDIMLNATTAVGLLSQLNKVQGGTKHIKASEGLLKAAEEASKQWCKHKALVSRAYSIFDENEEIDDDIAETTFQIEQVEKELAKYEECKYCSGKGVHVHA